MTHDFIASFEREVRAACPQFAARVLELEEPMRAFLAAGERIPQVAEMFERAEAILSGAGGLGARLMAVLSVMQEAGAVIQAYGGSNDLQAARWQ